jgi:hypothetical protein
MGISKNKKLLINGAIGFIGALAITTGVLLLIAPKDKGDSANNTATPTANTVVDTEICRVLGIDNVQAALKNKVDPIYGPNLIGLATLPNNDTVHVCTYPFVSDASAENNYRIDNGLSFEVYAHVSEDTKKAFASVNDAANGSEAISGLGERAVYAPLKFSDNSMRYELVVYSGLKHYTFRIAQPEGITTFDTDSAKTVLTELAKTVSF